MNRTDRLLAIVLELQGKDFQRAEDLASRFEVSTRTIYRDMGALSEVGVPIVAVQRKGYSLVEGYFLPPLQFSTEEALMLALGSEFMRQNFDAQYQKAAQYAYRKIEAVLPGGLRDEVQYLSENIVFYATSPLEENKLIILGQVRRAIVERKVIQLHYAKKYAVSDEEAFSIRAVSPYSLARLSDDWYLMAYCHLRKDIRVFRFSRIAHLKLLSKTFERPHDFRPEWVGSDEKRSVTVQALLHIAVKPQLMESLPFSIVNMEDRIDGVVMTFKVRDERDIMPWLLSWGQQVTILEPESLRKRWRDEIEKMFMKCDQV